MNNTAYAHTDNKGQIFVKTVSETKRAAMVNTLVTLFREPVYQQDSDNHIASLYTEKTNQYGGSIKPVTIHISNVI
tara:strand:+ start:341 stop:568 length:228 start_codon:yes stop_codon:yes gene_type:complete